MKKRILYGLIVVGLQGLVLFLSPPVSSAQRLENDQEERFTLPKPGIDELRKEIPEPAMQDARESREIKYVEGKDGTWFTADDQIYHYFLPEYDDKGRMSKKSCFKAGADGIAQSSDDELVDYQTFEYGPDNNIQTETSFDAKGAKQYTIVYDYDAKGRKVKAARVNPNNEQIRSTVFYYNSRGLLVKDVEFAGKDIEKYHRYEYDRKGIMTKAMEYHVKQNGKGPDGKWFTADDVVSSTKEFFYNKNGTKAMEKKYIGAGPDGAWFTKDDVLQYYTLFYYGK